MDSESINKSATACADKLSAVPPARRWFVPIICALITAIGAGFTAYSNHKNQSEIEALKAISSQQVAKIKADTEYQIAQAEFRSKENIIRLTDQLEAEKELRNKAASSEYRALLSRSNRCDEIKKVWDQMNIDINHIRYNDPAREDALVRLSVAASKSNYYLSNPSLKEVLEAMPKKASQDYMESRLEYYNAVLRGYSVELRSSCP